MTWTHSIEIERIYIFFLKNDLILRVHNEIELLLDWPRIIEQIKFQIILMHKFFFCLTFLADSG